MSEVSQELRYSSGNLFSCCTAILATRWWSWSAAPIQASTRGSRTALLDAALSTTESARPRTVGEVSVT